MKGNKLNKYILVTGAGGDIAQALIEKLVILDYKIIGLDIKECVDKSIFHYYLDLSNTTAITDFVQTTALEWIDKLESIVHLAGVYPNKKSYEYDDSLWDFVFSVNVKSIFFLINAILKFETPNFKAVVLVSSMASKIGSNDPAYAASKAALNGLGNSLSKTLAERNIRVNTVLPGIIDTNMSKVQSEERKIYHVSKTLSKKIGKPYEVANLITFLLSEESSYIWGGKFEVNGGMSL